MEIHKIPADFAISSSTGQRMRYNGMLGVRVFVAVIFCIIVDGNELKYRGKKQL